MTEDAHKTGTSSSDPTRTTSDRPAGDPPPPPPGAIMSDPPATSTGTLVAPPPTPPGTTGAGHRGGRVPPAGTPERERPGLGGLLVALGCGLLAAAIGISTFRSRADGELDWSNYVVGLGATAALLLVAAAAVPFRKGVVGRELVGWPGAVGILGAGAMIAIGLADVGDLGDVMAYIVGGAILGLSVLGYLASRHGAYVVTAILGFFLIYVQLFDDLLGDSADNDNGYILVAAAVAVFVLLVTAVGWLLPTRALSGIIVGAGGVVSYASLLAALLAIRAFEDMFAPVSADGADDGSVEFLSGGAGDFENDVWVILGFAALLTLVWAIAAAVTAHGGFTVLAIAMPVATVPIASIVLAVEHPTWWGVALAAVGALLLAGAALRLIRARRRHDDVAHP